jgi:hypothetical protein
MIDFRHIAVKWFEYPLDENSFSCTAAVTSGHTMDSLTFRAKLVYLFLNCSSIQGAAEKPDGFQNEITH